MTSPTTTAPRVADFARTLTDANTPLVNGLVHHNWMQALGSNSLPVPAFVAWAQQRRVLVLHEERTLLYLCSLDAPERLRGPLAHLASEAMRQAGEFAEMLIGLDADVTDEPQPACLGYGSFLRRCATSTTTPTTPACPTPPENLTQTSTSPRPKIVRPPVCAGGSRH